MGIWCIRVHLTRARRTALHIPSISLRVAPHARTIATWSLSKGNLRNFDSCVQFWYCLVRNGDAPSYYTRWLFTYEFPGPGSMTGYWYGTHFLKCNREAINIKDYYLFSLWKLAHKHMATCPGNDAFGSLFFAASYFPLLFSSSSLSLLLRHLIVFISERVLMWAKKNNFLTTWSKREMFSSNLSLNKENKFRHVKVSNGWWWLDFCF